MQPRLLLLQSSLLLLQQRLQNWYVSPYLRIAADKHYFTDVATGAATGSNQMLLGAVGSFKGAGSRDAAGVPSGRGRLPAEQ